MTKWYRVPREKNNLLHDLVSGKITSFFENDDPDADFFIVHVEASEIEQNKVIENGLGLAINAPF